MQRREASTIRKNGAMATVTLRPATVDDFEWIVELKSRVLFDDLSRLGRWNPERVRQRLAAAFRPENTSIILADGRPVGSVSVRREPSEKWIEAFYIDANYQGRGIGSEVLRGILTSHADALPFRLNVLQGSAARRLYERYGFVWEADDPIDVFLVRHPA
ncbi:GNAT family N-acetyltransferase [Glaciihabitans sp. dw_435]|uniref:GNAT family N-acetyltransferase n=1 Tax=Glaciihabitans sp. dw_435 TaxID=2720081 RepID=UPI00210779CE|nr:GNAT family N-acetyltransferase [Glaciihabitans sp. dw_435]